MKNIMIWLKNRIGIALCMLCFVSCNLFEDGITTWYKVSGETKLWLTDSSDFCFRMADQNGITREYLNVQNTHDFSEGESFFCGIKYQISQRENYYQSFYSTFNDVFSFSLSPGCDNDYWGDRFSLSINSLSFTYDFLLERLVIIETNCNYLSHTITTSGVENDSLIHSTIDFYDEIELNGTIYPHVFHFILSDFQQNWTEYTVTEVYYARKLGLLEYRYKNGLSFTRQ